MEFKKLDTQIEINGKKIPVLVTIEVEEDFETNIEDDYASGDVNQDKAYFARFKRGELFMGLIIVKASALGETGSNILSACHLSANNYFNSKPFEESVTEHLENYKMIDNALFDLICIIKERAREFAPYVE